MRVFLSWSGARSQTAADVYHDLFAFVMQTAEIFAIDDNARLGSEWAVEVRHMLATADAALAFITDENIRSPWMLFEAGAWWATEAYFVPVLVNVATVDLTGPLTQFQTISTSQSDTLRLFMQLNRRAPRPLPEATLARAFERVWPELGDRLAVISEHKVVVDKQGNESPFWKAQAAPKDDEILQLLRELRADLKKLASKTGA